MTFKICRRHQQVPTGFEPAISPVGDGPYRGTRGIGLIGNDRLTETETENPVNRPFLG